MPSHPLVSIIIPAYNNGHFISGAIHSCLEQTYQFVEVIVVDDGSADDTESIVKGIEDDRLIYIRHEKNLGVSVAKNTGI